MVVPCLIFLFSFYASWWISCESYNFEILNVGIRGSMLAGSTHFMSLGNNLKWGLLWRVISFFQYANNVTYWTLFAKSYQFDFFFLKQLNTRLNWFLCTNTTMIMPKSWNINYVISMLNVFHAKYSHIFMKIFYMCKLF